MKRIIPHLFVGQIIWYVKTCLFDEEFGAQFVKTDTFEPVFPPKKTESLTPLFHLVFFLRVFTAPHKSPADAMMRISSRSSGSFSSKPKRTHSSAGDTRRGHDPKADTSSAHAQEAAERFLGDTGARSETETEVWMLRLERELLLYDSSRCRAQGLGQKSRTPRARAAAVLLGLGPF